MQRLEDTPLAARFRPRTLEEYIGQKHLLAPGKPLRRLIEADRLSSILLFGPPGTGKTSLAEVIARRTRSRFERLNATDATVSDLRKVLSAADLRLRHTRERTVLFLDEIHRFNKAQQDVLLPDVERGTVRLIGATTHNPSFYVNGPLVSRSHLFELEPLTQEDLRSLVLSALGDNERGLGRYCATVSEEALRHLIAISEGDARKVLNALELAVLTTPPGDGAEAQVVVTLEDTEACVQKKRVLYDANEDQHYDTISAFIKSVRGSDPDAALYWLAKMVEAGEDPRFIARRLVILASEDIGLADPRGLMVAVAAHQAVEFIGWPEGRITLAQATIYLATAPKSNSSVAAIGRAIEAVQQEATVPVPRHLRDAHYPGAKGLGNGEGYQYSHDFPEAIAPQGYGIEPRRFYQPTRHGAEKQIAERLAAWERLRREGGGGDTAAVP
ncbi:AAA family ATPase [Verrucomicrobia bacterium LW23]|nr:AAA family ATPase [Verrucomicrobia bacterium LW23]